METRKNKRVRRSLVLGLLLIAAGFGFGRPAIKVRVTVDNASVKATPAIGGQNVATVPLDTVLDAESKQGEWYKVRLRPGRGPGHRVHPRDSGHGNQRGRGPAGAEPIGTRQGPGGHHR